MFEEYFPLLSPFYSNSPAVAIESYIVSGNTKGRYYFRTRMIYLF